MNALFLGTKKDAQYAHHLKGLFNGLSTYLVFEPVTMLAELGMYCTKRKITKVVSTNTDILKKCLEKLGNTVANPALSDYQGSVFKIQNDAIEIVFISPLDQLFTVPYGKFIAARFISKVVAPEAWAEPTAFKWGILKPHNIQVAYTELSKAIAIAIDIETLKTNLAIRCVGFTGVFVTSTGGLETKSYVLPLEDEWSLAWLRHINNLPIAKIFQNGKYDNAYLLRYNAAPINWLWDTAHFFHSWYSELPKNLAFLNAFFLRSVVYWKDLAETTDREEYFRYNALDTWATANVWIQQLLSSPDWVQRNYTLAFPLVFPCLLSEMTGLARNPERLATARAQITAEESTTLSSLRNCLGVPTFNPNSTVQVKQLLSVLGCGDLPSSDETHLKIASFKHPLNDFLLGKVLVIRGLRKIKNTYLRTDEDITATSKIGSKDYHGFILYSLNPHGTDTCRLASRESAFWVGANIQNIPQGRTVKQTIEAFPGFFIAECDLEQAESRDTGYISGDIKLIEAVSGSGDFHSRNASAFFGIPYAQIYDNKNRKVIDKPIRTLGKPINHGANYNMGAGVLVDSMTLPLIYKARDVLKLPFTNPIDIATCLLTTFHLTYPGLKGITVFKNNKIRAYFKLPTPNVEYKLYTPGTYYADTAQEIRLTSKLTGRAFHHTPYNMSRLGGSLWNSNEEQIQAIINQDGDWTRYCFGKPWETKLALNAYVAHRPQSLNARTLNEAFMQIFYNVALPNPTTFRLNAQVHDSILFQYAKGSEHHVEAVRQHMEIPVTVKDIHGIFRTFTVPAATKVGTVNAAEGLVRATFWSDIE